MTDQLKKEYAIPGAAALASIPLLYAGLRKGKVPVNWVTEKGAFSSIKNPITKLWNKLKYSGFNILEHSGSRKSSNVLSNLKGKTYLDTDAFANNYGIKNTADTFNTAKGKITKYFQDKYNFSKTDKSGVILKSKRLDLSKVNTSEELYSKLKNIKENKYIKPSVDFAGQGAHISNKDLSTFKNLKYNELSPKLKSKLNALLKEKENYIVQDTIPLRLANSVGNNLRPVEESRFNFMVDKGKIKPIYDVKRWNFGSLPFNGAPDSKLEKQFYSFAKKYVKNNPKIFKDNFVLGADVVRDTSGKMRVIELNDQSGFLHGPLGPAKLYKAMSGNDTPIISAAKAVAGGTLLGTGAYGVKKLIDKKE